MNKFKKFLGNLSNFGLSLITFSAIKSPLAQIKEMPTLYGPAPVPVYGMVAPSPTSIILMILGWVVLPLAIIIGLIVGLVVYTRKKRKNAQKDTQDGPTQNLG